MHQMGWLSRMAAAQFPFPLAALALVPVVSLPWLKQRARRGMAMVMLATLLFSVVVLIGVNPQLDIQNMLISQVIFIPFFALIALLAGFGFILVIRVLTRRQP